MNNQRLIYGKKMMPALYPEMKRIIEVKDNVQGYQGNEENVQQVRHPPRRPYSPGMYF
jgi:hypothetical protein